MTPIDAPSPTEAEIFAARLAPHRSLNKAQCRALLAAFAAACLALGLMFYTLGAWPVAGFFGLDAAALYIAFRASFRAARGYEDISLSFLELRVAKVSPAGRRREWRFHPAWVRVEREDHAEFGLQRLALRQRGERLILAAFLGAEAKERFADQLAGALAQARRGVDFS